MSRLALVGFAQAGSASCGDLGRPAPRQKRVDALGGLAGLDEGVQRGGTPPASEPAKVQFLLPMATQRMARHAGYLASQRIRKRIEEAFGWMKNVGAMQRPIHCGTDKVRRAFTLAAAAYNLIRMPNRRERLSSLLDQAFFNSRLSP